MQGANARERNPLLSILPRLSFGLAGLCALAAAVAGFGHRAGLWDFTTGFLILRWAAYTAALAAAGAIVTILLAVPKADRAAFGWSLAALFIALAVVIPPLVQLRKAQAVPAIHDITTDTENPPAFVDVLPLRKKAPNPVGYGGPAVAALQREAYPDIKPLLLRVPPSRVFEAALAAAWEMGWDLIAVKPEEGRIEATATTFWFGFKDDIVIRVRLQNGGSRVDARSVSRVGQSDIGANASRIRHFLVALQKELSRGSRP